MHHDRFEGFVLRPSRIHLLDSVGQFDVHVAIGYAVELYALEGTVYSLPNTYVLDFFQLTAYPFSLTAHFPFPTFDVVVEVSIPMLLIV